MRSPGHEIRIAHRHIIAHTWKLSIRAKPKIHIVNVKEYISNEGLIADLENDPNVPVDKVEKLRSSLKDLKNKTSIKIRNGEIIKFNQSTLI